MFAPSLSADRNDAPWVTLGDAGFPKVTQGDFLFLNPVRFVRFA